MEKPILFSIEMVRQILAGRKTQTRRVVKEIAIPDEWEAVNRCRIVNDSDVPCYVVRRKVNEKRGIYYPRYDVGDILWVRETWAGLSYCSTDGDLGFGVHYKAGGKEKFFEFNDVERFHHFGQMIIKNDGWISSIFMPKEAARLFLKVTNVRVERLWDITKDDCWDEGCVTDPFNYQEPEYYERFPTELFERSCFMGLWDSLYQKQGYGWQTNPWVWVYEFEKVR